MTEGPIEPPSPHPKRALARGVAEGAIEILPGASLLTKIYAVTHPPIEELERQRWEVDMSRRSNEQDELLKRLVGAHRPAYRKSAEGIRACKRSHVGQAPQDFAGIGSVRRGNSRARVAKSPVSPHPAACGSLVRRVGRRRS